MKKNFLIIVFIVLFMNSVCFAEVFKAQVITKFTTENPPETIIIKAKSDMIIDDLNLKKGYIITGKIIDLVSPKAWGKNATFSLKLVQYIDEKGISHELTKDYIIKYRQKLKPNWERQSFSLMGSTNGGKTESGITFSPYDVKLMKESKNVGDFLWKEANKDAMWQDGWELKYKQNETIYFNY